MPPLSHSTKIAMWSGPRNLSTAMMYAFGNRADCTVTDEPYYAAYLARTGLNHPMREDILAGQPTEVAKVSALLAGPNPEGRAIWYQKHMCQHMEDVPLDWAASCKHVFLLRHPARVVASYSAKHKHPDLEDIGFTAQTRLYERLGGIVVESSDIRMSPEPMLRALCKAVDIPFDPAMLTWPKGGHRADGVWASHWYGAAHASTGFSGPEGPLPKLSGHSEALVRQALPHYEALSALAIKP